MKFLEEFKLQKNCEINLLIKTFLGLVEMTFGLVNVSFSLPEWQAVKMTFFAPWLLALLIAHWWTICHPCNPVHVNVIKANAFKKT